MQATEHFVELKKKKIAFGHQGTKQQHCSSDLLILSQYLFKRQRLVFLLLQLYRKN